MSGKLRGSPLFLRADREDVSPAPDDAKRRNLQRLAADHVHIGGGRERGDTAPCEIPLPEPPGTRGEGRPGLSPPHPGQPGRAAPPGGLLPAPSYLQRQGKGSLSYRAHAKRKRLFLPLKRERECRFFFE